MTDQFLGEIRMFAGTFAPAQWAFCAGQLMSISQNSALFSLLGTSYGGNGTTTFGLPDLRGRAPVCMGQGSGLSQYVLGEVTGTPTTQLLATQMPSHTHGLVATSSVGTTTAPSGQQLAAGYTGSVRSSTSVNMYSSAAPGQAMAPVAVGGAGASGPHNNMMPYQAVNFIIALSGNYPTRP